jgi:hypothetical protein
MILRWIVFGVIAWLLVIAVTVSLLAKPAGAADTIGPMIVCEPKAMTDDLEKQRAERITRT